jgi:hypothetical protein
VPGSPGVGTLSGSSGCSTTGAERRRVAGRSGAAPGRRGGSWSGTTRTLTARGRAGPASGRVTAVRGLEKVTDG